MSDMTVTVCFVPPDHFYPQRQADQDLLASCSRGQFERMFTLPDMALVVTLLGERNVCLVVEETSYITQ